VDYSTIRLIRQRVLTDLETCIPYGSYKWNDTSQESIAGLDLSIGFRVFTRNDNDQPFLSPRQRAAGVVLMLIGQHRLCCRESPSGATVAKRLDATLAEFQLMVERYLLHVDPNEARPIRAAMDGTLTRPAEDTGGATPGPPKQRTQERRILELISESGHRAKALPARRRGVKGVKSEIRELALRDSTLFSDSSFEKAWQRLRGFGDIQGAE
jgi:hypothetical protein